MKTLLVSAIAVLFTASQVVAECPPWYYDAAGNQILVLGQEEAAIDPPYGTGNTCDIYRPEDGSASPLFLTCVDVGEAYVAEISGDTVQLEQLVGDNIGAKIALTRNCPDSPPPVGNGSADQ